MKIKSHFYQYISLPQNRHYTGRLLVFFQCFCVRNFQQGTRHFTPFNSFLVCTWNFVPHQKFLCTQRVLAFQLALDGVTLKKFWTQISRSETSGIISIRFSVGMRTSRMTWTRRINGGTCPYIGASRHLFAIFTPSLTFTAKSAYIVFQYV